MKNKIKPITEKLDYEFLLGKKINYTEEEYEKIKWMYELLGWDKE